jgi:excisionase family DNA binding protein
MTILSTKEAAARLGVTMKRVQAMIRAQRLPAQKVGRDYIIQEIDLKIVADRKPGRPRKPQAAAATKKSSKTK